MPEIFTLLLLWGLVGLLNLPSGFPTLFRKLREFFQIEEEERKLKRIGLIIGICEGLIVVTFSFFRAWQALSLVFGGKILFRVLEKERKEILNYYLTGSLLNFTFWLMIGTIFSMLR
ncbi:hypothetical protein J7K56_03080 [Candidatus Calescamantes bacterium]|nr:hypothetical protein [Candidatus Calescamantes bacterium]